MSLLSNVEPTPARVLGTYRYLVAYGPLPLDALAAQVWPVEVRSDASRVDAVLRLEMIEAGLLDETEEGLRPHPDLPESVRADAAAAVDHLPLALADLVLTGPARNADLAHALAWYLSLDPRTAPGHDTAVVAQAAADGVADLVGITANATFGMFEDWATYLGFGWVLPALGAADKTRLVPDPTVYLRRLLPDLLPDVGTPVPVGTFRAHLAERAPVFEGGRSAVL